MRKIILFLIGVVLIVGSFFVLQNMSTQDQKPKPIKAKTVKKAYYSIVENKALNFDITATGRLEPKYRMDLVSEVQGVLKPSSKELKVGSKYKKGEQVLNINSDEYYTDILAQKSQFYSLIVSILPDVKIDYPDEYQKWKTYLDEFSVKQKLKALPKFNSNKERYFIESRNISSTYYGIKKMEIKLNKYKLYSPYNSSITEVFVTPGTLIKTGQVVASLIGLDVFELQLSVNSKEAELLSVNGTVEVVNPENGRKYSGKIVRIGDEINSKNQTIALFVQLKHKDLKSGLYLEANLKSNYSENAVEVDRSLLINEQKLFIVNESKLKLVDIDPVYFTQDKVFIKGLSDGLKILAAPVVGAFEGMEVTPILDTETK